VAALHYQYLILIFRKNASLLPEQSLSFHLSLNATGQKLAGNVKTIYSVTGNKNIWVIFLEIK